VTIVYVTITFLTISYLAETIRYTRVGLILPTFLFAFLIDQVKQIGVLSLAYIVVAKRFLHLSVTIEQEEGEDTKTETMIPRLKGFCMKVVESTVFETISMILISLYTIFILFWLTMAELIGLSDMFLSKIDTAFLVLFFAEISLKCFASNFLYLLDIFNAFDCIIVIASGVLNMIGVIARGFGVLRLIRVVVITIRKITGNQSKLRHASKNINPVESVIKILQQIADEKNVSNAIKKEARWAIEIIESNKLFDLNVDISGDEKNMDADSKAWLNLTTENANDATQWFERDLDDFLKEIHRE